MSHAITTEVLQEQLGFEGLIFTDGLAMQGVIDNVGTVSYTHLVLSSTDKCVPCDQIEPGELTPTDPLRPSPVIRRSMPPSW